MAMKRAYPWMFIAIAAGAPACTSSGGDDTRDPVVVASDPYTLQPGEEKYFCYTRILDEDLVVSGLSPTYGDGTHHIIIAQSIANEPAGFQECNVLFKATWIPLFLGGKGTTAVHFPDGAGYKLMKGTPVVMQLHLQNPTDKPITASTSMALENLDPAKPFTPAGIFGLDNRKLTIPAGATGVEASMTCNTHGKTLDVFATLAHMHKHGRHVRVTRNTEADVVFDGDWNFDDQATSHQTMSITPSDMLTLKCRFDNPTAADLNYGESSDDEMCAFAFYYTTFQGLDGCLQM